SLGGIWHLLSGICRRYVSGGLVGSVRPMNEKRQRVRRPLWVQLGLYGLPSRGAALAFFWLCVVLVVGLCCVAVVLAVAGVCSAYWVALLFAAFMLSWAGLWYGLAIRWVDRHDRWD